MVANKLCNATLVRLNTQLDKSERNDLEISFRQLFI